jgi:hypothetical protein
MICGKLKGYLQGILLVDRYFVVCFYLVHHPPFEGKAYPVGKIGFTPFIGDVGILRNNCPRRCRNTGVILNQ